MTKRKKCIIIILLFTVSVISIAYVSVRAWVNNKARQVAENFLAKKYQETMIYKRVDRLPFMCDGGYYEVVFYPKSNEDFEFYVQVRCYPYFTIFEEKEKESEGTRVVSDNYLISRFNSEIKTVLADKLSYERKIIDIAIFNGMDEILFIQKINLTESSSFNEAEKLINYGLRIEVKSDVEGSELWNILQTIKAAGFLPEEVIFAIKKPFNKKRFIHLEDWQNIDEKEISDRLSDAN